VDWHGVLSRDPFWLSILERPTHPLRPALSARLNHIFGPDGDHNTWMLGRRSAAEVVSGMNIRLDRRFKADYLVRRLELDCGRMRVNVELVELLQWARACAFVVIATDNVDSFVRAFDTARGHRRRPLAPDETNDTFDRAARAWDDLICSSDVGTLKSHNPAGFFGSWLHAHRLSFDGAMLIDDRADNCEAFTAQGGTAVRWKFGQDDPAVVQDAMRAWLDGASAHPVPVIDG
jgi:hypothetical protein